MVPGVRGRLIHRKGSIRPTCDVLSPPNPREPLPGHPGPTAKSWSRTVNWLPPSGQRLRNRISGFEPGEAPGIGMVRSDEMFLSINITDTRIGAKNHAQNLLYTGIPYNRHLNGASTPDLHSPRPV